MDLAARIDQYCERLDPGFWAEPANALSNIAFVIAALAALTLWRRRSPGDMGVLALIVVVFCVAAGSFAFHTWATRGTEMLDVIPISLFIFGYFYLAMMRYFGVSAWTALGLTAAFGFTSYWIVGVAHPVVGSSAGYVPALLAIFGVAIAVWRRDAQLTNGLFVAGLLFALSLSFRTADGPMCERFPIGTHFMWHILNAMVLNLLLRAMIRFNSRQYRTAPAQAA